MRGDAGRDFDRHDALLDLATLLEHFHDIAVPPSALQRRSWNRDCVLCRGQDDVHLSRHAGLQLAVGVVDVEQAIVVYAALVLLDEVVVLSIEVGAGATVRSVAKCLVRELPSVVK